MYSLIFIFFLEGMCKCQPKVPSESTRGLQSKLRQTEDLAINSSILSFISNSSDWSLWEQTKQKMLLI